MRARLAIAVLVIRTVVAWANSETIDGQSVMAFSIVAFWTLVIESGIATFGLVSSGLLIVPTLAALIFANFALFLLDELDRL